VNEHSPMNVSVSLCFKLHNEYINIASNSLYFLFLLSGGFGVDLLRSTTASRPTSQQRNLTETTCTDVKTAAGNTWIIGCV